MATKIKTPRWGWALTGSGHFFKECLAMIGELDDVDLFVSKAASEVVRMYRQEFKLPKSANVFAQAGKCRVPAIVFACDTAPELETEAPKGMVKVYPRKIDLENTERLKSFESTEVVETLAELEQTLAGRKRELARP